MSLWLSVQCLLLSLPAVHQIRKEIHKYAPASNFAQQVGPIMRDRSYVSSPHLSLNSRDMIPSDTGILMHRSYQKEAHKKYRNVFLCIIWCIFHGC